LYGGDSLGYRLQGDRIPVQATRRHDYRQKTFLATGKQDTGRGQLGYRLQGTGYKQETAGIQAKRRKDQRRDTGYRKTGLKAGDSLGYRIQAGYSLGYRTQAGDSLGSRIQAGDSLG
jgi:hypothetical protein